MGNYLINLSGFFKSKTGILNIFIIFAFLSINSTINAQISIYDIQYTVTPGYDGYYPSPYEGQLVEIGGIVTGINFNGNRYFISSSSGGSWNGIYIYDNWHNPEIGDSVIITGQVYEYNGLTEISNVTSFEIVNSDNELPQPTDISTFDVSLEQYESVVVQLNDVVVTGSYNQWSEWVVNDGSGDATVSTGFNNFEDDGFPMSEDLVFETITGINTFFWNERQINPRGLSDLIVGEVGYSVSTNSNNYYDVDEITVPIHISCFGDSEPIENYQLDFSFNSEVISFINFDVNGTLSENGELSTNIDDSNVQLNYNGDFSFSDSGILMNLNFDVIASGNTGMQLNSVIIDDAEHFVSSGEIYIYNDNDPIGDTLTVIQRPILNIPEIVLPNDEMEIVCLANESTENWQAELLFDEIVIELPIVSTNYEIETGEWFLTAEIPIPPLYELYDLHVTASNEISDTTKNSVQLIPEERDNYYFVHLTDPHLPTHTFWSDDPEEALTDTSEMTDLREVINDINLLNPEFVLLTGDLVNEGELEDFQNGRAYTKAKRILGEFEVPVYLVSGNHDIGGWVDTPAPQGTARRNWWRFFGWNSLEYPPIYTQNYTFSYGNILFLGMEAYDNYDSFMFDVYDQYSFISSQLDWLDTQLANAAGYDARVLFYHYDFSNQINLSYLGIEMALWGHIHSNSGSIYSQPYNLATDNTCDNTCAYRVVSVNNNILSPQNTIYANSGGDNLHVEFYPSNEGICDSINAEIHNDHNIDFENAKIKFVFPTGNFYYEVTNGTFYQVDDSGEFNICYVNVNLPANSDISVTINANAFIYGDLDGDEDVNVLDVVLAVNFVLGIEEPSSEQFHAGDLNNDGTLDIPDLVAIVYLILSI